MLLDLNDLVQKYDLKITGILHLGAHLAEEAPLYHSLGISNIWWVEGNGDNIPKIDKVVLPHGQHHAIEALISDKQGEEVTFHITNYESMSSSMLEFGTHTSFSPDTVFVEHRTLYTVTLDNLFQYYKFADVNFLNMDLQGCELKALKGGLKLLPQLQFIYSEVNRAQVYVNCAQVDELDEFLSDFDRVETGWTVNDWGDGLWIRK